MDGAFCWRCKEDFPVAEEPTTWRMGELRSIKEAPKKIRKLFGGWLSSKIHDDESFLCGNCYFDLNDAPC